MHVKWPIFRGVRVILGTPTSSHKVCQQSFYLVVNVVAGGVYMKQDIKSLIF